MVNYIPALEANSCFAGTTPPSSDLEEASTSEVNSAGKCFHRVKHVEAGSSVGKAVCISGWPLNLVVCFPYGSDLGCRKLQG